MESRVPFEPGANLGMLVRRMVVDDQMQFPPTRHLAVDLVGEADAGALDSLKVFTRCGFRPCGVQTRRTLRWLLPAALAIARPVQCVRSCGGSASVGAVTRAIVCAVGGGLSGGQVASCCSPSIPLP